MFVDAKAATTPALSKLPFPWFLPVKMASTLSFLIWHFHLRMQLVPMQRWWVEKVASWPS